MYNQRNTSKHQTGYILHPIWPYPTIQSHFDAWSELTGYELMSAEHFKTLCFQKMGRIEKRCLQLAGIVNYLKWALLGFPRDFSSPNGIRIGHHVIERILKSDKIGQFRFLNWKNLRTFTQSYTLASIAHKSLNSSQVKVNLVGDEAYTDGILAQVTSFEGIPTIKIRPFSDSIALLPFNPKLGFGGPDFYSIPQLHSITSAQTKLQLEELENRVAGNYEGLSYMRSSESTVPWNPSKNAEKCVVMFLHDFRDSIGIYGSTTFIDQWRWIEITRQVVKAQRAQLYIKLHPNEHPKSQKANEEVIKLIKLAGDRVQLIPAATPLREVKTKLQPLAILSMHGSVAAEAAVASIPFLCTSTHPLIAANVGMRATSEGDYKRKLRLILRGNGKVNIDAHERAARAVLSTKAWYAIHGIQGIPFDDCDKKLMEDAGFTLPENSNIHDRRALIMVSKRNWTQQHQTLYKMTKELILSNKNYVEIVRQIVV